MYSFLLLCVLPSVAATFCPNGFDYALSSYRQDGGGFQSMGDPHKKVCFITRGSAWRSDPAGCNIQPVNGDLRLVASSGHSDVSCGAYCVSCAGNPNRKRWTLTGTGKLNMIDSTKGFCFLVQGQAFKDGNDGCKIDNSGGYWSLETTSNQGSFVCAAECYVSNTTTVSSEYLLSGTGGGSKYMSATKTTICFLTNIAGLYEGHEVCSVGMDGDYWKLSKAAGSKQGGLRCGARCVAVSPHFPRTSGRWVLVKDNWDGAVSGTITTGVQTSETKTITKEYSFSFTASIEAGCEFEKVTMSWTAEHSVANSVSDEITHIATHSETASCPQDTHTSEPMHTWLYQWVVDGYREKGNTNPDASVFSIHSRCQYTNATEDEMPPKCPFRFCGDAHCTANNCKDWKKNESATQTIGLKNYLRTAVG